MAASCPPGWQIPCSTSWSALARLTLIGELRSEHADGILAAFSADVASGALRRLPVESAAFAWARDRLSSRQPLLRTLDALLAR